MSAPEGLTALLEHCGAPWIETLRAALNGEPTVAVRFNRRKAPAGSRPPGSRAVEWCGRGWHLRQRLRFTMDPAMHQGIYYVQDASSMFVDFVVRRLVAESGHPVVALDACAAPGGKTTALIDALPEGSLVVANEYEPKRAAVLRENLAKWGYPFVAVTEGDTSRFASMSGAFDLMLADVPCSGEGMMRKEDEAVARWCPGLIAECVERQRAIIDNLWPALRPGGYLIYSTCTFNPSENEEMLDYIRSRHGGEPVDMPVPESWGIAPQLSGLMPARRFIPGLVEGEGLFMGVVRKPDDVDVPSTPKSVREKRRQQKHKAGAKKQPLIPKEVDRWFLPGFNPSLRIDGDRLMARIERDEWPIEAEFEAGALKGRDILPSQQLALSLMLNRDAFECVEVDRAQAIDYLRCEAVSLPEHTPRGIVLLTYAGNPLGFVKNVGNRANNLYPKAWRIVSQRPPQLPPALMDDDGPSSGQPE